MTALDKDYHHRLRLKFSSGLAIVNVFGTMARFSIMNYLPPYIAWLGVLNIFVATSVWLIIRGNYLPRIEAVLNMAVCLIVVMPLILTTGGVNSQYIYMLPLAPALAALLGSVRLTGVVAALLIVAAIGMYMTADIWPDLTGYIFFEEKTRVRTIWLVVAIVLASGFGVYFRRSYDAQSELLDRLAAIDHMTGLLNRRGLEGRLQEELQRCIRSGQPLSVLMIDVDFFKRFNDLCGHEAGDTCLIELAHCLRKHTRVEDVISRYGGEEFLVVLGNTSAEDAAIVAEKLRAAVAEMDPLRDGTSITVTIGVSSMPAGVTQDNHPAAEELIRQADSALYKGKHAGRNQVAFYP